MDTMDVELNNVDLNQIMRDFYDPWVKQQEEINYLKTYHSSIVEKYEQPFKEDAIPSEKSIALRNSILDVINCEIIIKKIDKKSTILNLHKAGITRLPTMLFDLPGYIEFWKNLLTLDCDENQIHELDLQKLTALQDLNCQQNNIEKLDIRGLNKLLRLNCSNNQLKILNLQGLVSLWWLQCTDNQLLKLNPKELSELQWLDCTNNKLRKLDIRGLKCLHRLDADDNPLKVLMLMIKKDYATIKCSEKLCRLLNNNSTMGINDDTSLTFAIASYSPYFDSLYDDANKDAMDLDESEPRKNIKLKKSLGHC